MKKLFFCLIIFGFMQKGFAQEPKLSDYVGKYKISDFFQEAVVTEKDGFLFAELDTYGNNKLLKEPQADTFKSTSEYGTVFAFKRDATTQKIVGITLTLMGQSVSGTKN